MAASVRDSTLTTASGQRRMVSTGDRHPTHLVLTPTTAAAAAAPSPS